MAILDTVFTIRSSNKQVPKDPFYMQKYPTKWDIVIFLWRNQSKKGKATAKEISNGRAGWEEKPSNPNHLPPTTPVCLQNQQHPTHTRAAGTRLKQKVLRAHRHQ